MESVIGHPIHRHVAFLGPFGVGKSTAVARLSDVPVVHTEVVSSSFVRGGRQMAKRTTTVGIDYGEWHSRRGERVALIGTPGQHRFQAVREAVAARTTAFVLLVYGDHEFAIDETIEWVQYFGGEAIVPRLVVGVTRTEHGGPPVGEYGPRLTAAGIHAPVLACDPRNATDVASVVLTSVERGRRASEHLVGKGTKERLRRLLERERAAARAAAATTGVSA